MLTVLIVGVVKGVDVAVLAVDTDDVASVVVTGVLAVVVFVVGAVDTGVVDVSALESTNEVFNHVQ